MNKEDNVMVKKMRIEIHKSEQIENYTDCQVQRTSDLLTLNEDEVFW